jgi:diguanylate cyclase (GGDEF)-like protein/PAS domain S-box-containing protein
MIWLPKRDFGAQQVATKLRLMMSRVLPFLDKQRGGASSKDQQVDDARVRLEAIINSSSDAIVGKTCEGIITSWNPGAERIFGYTAQEAIGRSTQILFPAGQTREELDILARIARGERVPHFDTVRLRKDGTLVNVSVTVSPVTDGHGTIVGASKIARDITRRKDDEAALRTSEARLGQLNANLKKAAAENALINDALFNEKERAQVTLDSIADAVVCTDIAGHVSYLNGAAERLMRWTSIDAMGRRLEEVFHLIEVESREVIPNPMTLAAEQNIVVGLPAMSVLIRRDGTELPIEDSCAPIHDRDGRVTGAVMVFHDVSTARDLSQQLAYQAAHDNLTDLPNRSLLSDRMAQAVAAAYRHHTILAVLYLDVDRFKHINDSLGHAIGDRLLQSIALRLTACVRTSDTVSRPGGDEFVIMLIDITGAHDAAICAEKMLESLRLPYVLDGHELHVSASMGIAICPLDGTEAEALLNSADSAMYEAKERGRNNYQFYRKDLNESAIARQTLENDLRHAVARQQLELHYQPIIDIPSRTVTGVEALLRWRHPIKGLLMPADFMAIAEESGLIVPIGQWVLRTTCLQAREWQLAGMASLRYAVNVSAVELRSKEFVTSVATIINETSIAPSIIELELTERYLMQDSKSTALVLKSLKDLHVNLALDDFGTGYSSLSYVRRFPIDTLKIDRSFVRDLVTDAADAGVVSAVINMGKSLHMLVVAEGVETREQLSFLETQRCPEAQGYLFSPPVVAEKFASLVVHSREEKLPFRLAPDALGH